MTPRNPSPVQQATPIHPRRGPAPDGQAAPIHPRYGPGPDGHVSQAAVRRRGRSPDPWPGRALAPRRRAADRRPRRRRAPGRGLDLLGGAVREGRRPLRLAVGAGAGLTFGAIGAIGVMGVPAAVPVALLAAVAWPVTRRVARRRATARRLAVRRESAPVVLDLLGAALLAGLNPHKAVLRVAERAPDVLRPDLDLAAAVLRLGGAPAAALNAAAERSGLDELRAAAAALEAAERWGAPPAEALAARAEALRSRARLHAEAEAGRAAVRLAFPLVFCFLPAFVLLTVVPTVAGALHALTP
jgi:tight adherence protein C